MADEEDENKQTNDAVEQKRPKFHAKILNNYTGSNVYIKSMREKLLGEISIKHKVGEKSVGALKVLSSDLKKAVTHRSPLKNVEPTNQEPPSPIKSHNISLDSEEPTTNESPVKSIEPTDMELESPIKSPILPIVSWEHETNPSVIKTVEPTYQELVSPNYKNQAASSCPPNTLKLTNELASPLKSPVISFDFMDQATNPSASETREIANQELQPPGTSSIIFPNLEDIVPYESQLMASEFDIEKFESSTELPSQTPITKEDWNQPNIFNVAKKTIQVKTRITTNERKSCLTHINTAGETPAEESFAQSNNIVCTNSAESVGYDDGYQRVTNDSSGIPNFTSTQFNKDAHSTYDNTSTVSENYGTAACYNNTYRQPLTYGSFNAMGCANPYTINNNFNQNQTHFNSGVYNPYRPAQFFQQRGYQQGYGGVPYGQPSPVIPYPYAYNSAILNPVTVKTGLNICSNPGVPVPGTSMPTDLYPPAFQTNGATTCTPVNSSSKSSAEKFLSDIEKGSRRSPLRSLSRERKYRDRKDKESRRSPLRSLSRERKYRGRKEKELRRSPLRSESAEQKYRDRKEEELCKSPLRRISRERKEKELEKSPLSNESAEPKENELRRSPLRSESVERKYRERKEKELRRSPWRSTSNERKYIDRKEKDLRRSPLRSESAERKYRERKEKELRRSPWRSTSGERKYRERKEKDNRKHSRYYVNEGHESRRERKRSPSPSYYRSSGYRKERTNERHKLKTGLRSREPYQQSTFPVDSTVKSRLSNNVVITDADIDIKKETETVNPSCDKEEEVRHVIYRKFDVNPKPEDEDPSNVNKINQEKDSEIEDGEIKDSVQIKYGEEDQKEKKEIDTEIIITKEIAIVIPVCSIVKIDKKKDDVVHDNSDLKSQAVVVKGKAVNLSLGNVEKKVNMNSHVEKTDRYESSKDDRSSTTTKDILSAKHVGKVHKSYKTGENRIDVKRTQEIAETKRNRTYRREKGEKSNRGCIADQKIERSAIMMDVKIADATSQKRIHQEHSSKISTTSKSRNVYELSKNEKMREKNGKMRHREEKTRIPSTLKIPKRSDMSHFKIPRLKKSETSNDDGSAQTNSRVLKNNIVKLSTTSPASRPDKDHVTVNNDQIKLANVETSEYKFNKIKKHRMIDTTLSKHHGKMSYGSTSNVKRQINVSLPRNDCPQMVDGSMSYVHDQKVVSLSHSSRRHSRKSQVAREVLKYDGHRARSRHSRHNLPSEVDEIARKRKRYTLDSNASLPKKRVRRIFLPDENSEPYLSICMSRFQDIGTEEIPHERVSDPSPTPSVYIDLTDEAKEKDVKNQTVRVDDGQHQDTQSNSPLQETCDDISCKPKSKKKRNKNKNKSRKTKENLEQNKPSTSECSGDVTKDMPMDGIPPKMFSINNSTSEKTKDIPAKETTANNGTPENREKESFISAFGIDNKDLEELSHLKELVSKMSEDGNVKEHGGSVTDIPTSDIEQACESVTSENETITVVSKKKKKKRGNNSGVSRKRGPKLKKGMKIQKKNTNVSETVNKQWNRCRLTELEKLQQDLKENFDVMSTPFVRSCRIQNPIIYKEPDNNNLPLRSAGRVKVPICAAAQDRTQSIETIDESDTSISSEGPMFSKISPSLGNSKAPNSEGTVEEFSIPEDILKKNKKSKSKKVHEKRTKNKETFESEIHQVEEGTENGRLRLTIKRRPTINTTENTFGHDVRDILSSSIQPTDNNRESDSTGTSLTVSEGDYDPSDFIYEPREWSEKRLRKRRKTINYFSETVVNGVSSTNLMSDTDSPKITSVVSLNKPCPKIVKTKLMNKLGIYTDCDIDDNSLIVDCEALASFKSPNQYKLQVNLVKMTANDIQNAAWEAVASDVNETSSKKKVQKRRRTLKWKFGSDPNKRKREKKAKNKKNYMVQQGESNSITNTDVSTVDCEDELTHDVDNTESNNLKNPLQFNVVKGPFYSLEDLDQMFADITDRDRFCEEGVKSVEIGPIRIAHRDGKLLYNCNLNDCFFDTYDLNMFTKHVNFTHVGIEWDGICSVCGKEYSNAIGCDLISAILHIVQNHVSSSNRQDGSLDEEHLQDTQDIETDCSSPPSGSCVEPVVVEAMNINEDGNIKITSLTFDNTPVASISNTIYGEPKNISSINVNKPTEKESRSVTPDIQKEQDIIFKIGNIISVNADAIVEDNPTGQESTSDTISTPEENRDDASFESIPEMNSSEPDINLVTTNILTKEDATSTLADDNVFNKIDNACLPNADIPKKAEQIETPVKFPRIRVRPMSELVEVADSGVGKESNSTISDNLSPSKTIEKSDNLVKKIIQLKKRKPLSNEWKSATCILKNNSDVTNKVAAAPLMVNNTIIPKENVTDCSSYTEKGRNNGGGNRSVVVNNSGVPKHEHMMEMMMAYNRMIDLYKCMDAGCSFTSSESLTFMRHLKSHSLAKRKGGKGLSSRHLTDTSHLVCAYCMIRFDTIELITLHINEVHSHCPYQCAYCFFRACKPCYILWHQNVSHVREKYRILKQLPEQSTAIPNHSLPLTEVVKPFKCSESCNFVTIAYSDFVGHLQNGHKFLNTFRCQICNGIYFSSSHLLRHIKLHGFGEYQCIYCVTGADTESEMRLHLTKCHYSCLPIAVKRILPTENPLKWCDAESITLKQLEESLLTVNLEEQVEGEFIQGVIKENNVKQLTADTAPAMKELLLAKPMVSNAPRNIMDNTKESTTTERAEGDEIFCNSNLLNRKRQCRTDSLSSRREEYRPVVKRKKTLDKTHLTDSELYRCCMHDCTEGYDTMQQLKEHVSKCSHSKDTRFPRCFHCHKEFKKSRSALEHYKLHGIPRYICPFCDKRSCLPHTMMQHCKVIHRISQSVISPVHPKREDHDKDFFACLPQVRKHETCLKAHGKKSRKKSKQSPKKVAMGGDDTILVYTCEEVEEYKSPIFSKIVMCGICKTYTTKVKTNMLWHIKNHPKGIALLKDIVNPVPAINKSDLMFNKMSNHAAYNAEPNTKTVQDSILTNETIDLSLPLFVPSNERYGCPSAECNYYKSLNSSMLKVHYETFHRSFETYRCPHCSVQVTVDRMPAHLKLHGGKLFKCPKCIYHHNSSFVVDKHIADKHPSELCRVMVIRDFNDDDDDNNASERTKTVESIGKPWHCELCTTRTVTMDEIIVHCKDSHNVNQRYKCALCSLSNDKRELVEQHAERFHPFTRKHIIACFYKEGEDEKEKDESPNVAKYESNKRELGEISVRTMGANDDKVGEEEVNIVIDGNDGNNEENATVVIEDDDDLEDSMRTMMTLTEDMLRNRNNNSIMINEDDDGDGDGDGDVQNNCNEFNIEDFIKIRSPNDNNDQTITLSQLDLEDESQWDVVEKEGFSRGNMKDDNAREEDEAPIMNIINNNGENENENAVREKSKDEVDETGFYKCPNCPKTFATISILEAHLYEDRKHILVCRCCGLKSYDKQVLTKHASEIHDNNVDCVEFESPNIKIEGWVERWLNAQRLLFEKNKQMALSAKNKDVNAAAAAEGDDDDNVLEVINLSDDEEDEACRESPIVLVDDETAETISKGEENSENDEGKTRSKERKILVKRINVKQQMTNKKDNNLFYCPECGCIYSSLNHLKDHLVKIHERTFFCRICFKAFNLESDAKKHQEREHNSDDSTTSDCPSSSSSSLENLRKEIIIKHRQTDTVVKKVFHCPSCSFATEVMQDAVNHAISAHVSTNYPEVHKCPSCDFIGNAEQLKKHDCNKLKQQPQDNTINMMTCSSCNESYAFDVKNRLKSQQNHKFTCKGTPTKLKCPFCPMTVKYDYVGYLSVVKHAETTHGNILMHSSASNRDWIKRITVIGNNKQKRLLTLEEVEELRKEENGGLIIKRVAKKSTSMKRFTTEPTLMSVPDFEGVSAVPPVPPVSTIEL